MHKKFLFNILGLMAVVATTTFSMQAFSTSIYTSTSKLANGRWVKIAIPENGIYQLTFEELSQMGFSNPEAVRIYGKGGYPISELLDGYTPDDLTQIPVKVYDNKICFYGCGPVKYTLSTPTGTPHYTRVFNSYSTKGYYFITQDDGTTPKVPEVITKDNTGTNPRVTSLNYNLHENDLISPGQMGKNMLGENMTNAEITLPYSLPGLKGDSAITINVRAGARVTQSSYIKAELNGIDMNYTLSSAKIYAPANTHVYYNWAEPYSALVPDTDNPVPENGNIRVRVYSPNGEVNNAWLDYILITYCHNNSLENGVDNQLNMGFNKCSVQDLISISNTSPSIEVWNINNPNNPTSYTLTQGDNGYYTFTPGNSNNWNQYVAFDPSKQLKSIDSYTEVENQNIHGLPTPNMVIVTCKNLIPQAERVAQMHRDNDNMIVHVIDEQQIFNEFSSGTPDAMAIRLMSKMFYDRDKNRFKNLLMFGAGSYDNRKILSSKECQLITYEAENSNDEEYSYVCDDFFGILDDNSGNELAKDYLRLGVGRIPCVTEAEAENDVDKLLNYVNNPDYGAWRNDLLLIADDYDDKKYAFQCEGLTTILDEDLHTGMAQNKVYCSQFPLDPVSQYGLEARKELTSKFKEGQYFMTYVGHGDKSYLTKEQQLWTVIESNTIENKHLPILTTACCDVARYDSNQRGLVEILFHKKGGGAIAMVTSARAVYADDNDALNQAFFRAMFCYHNKGYMPTLGEAYMLCKQSFGKTINYNKMSFMLLGDPAIKINYPKPFFKITKINGNTVGTSTISSGAMQEITVEAKVYTPNGSSVNTNFNGDATLSIYDILKYETTATQQIGQIYVDRDIYYPRNLLTRVNGRVVDGVFTAKAVIPRYILSSGGLGSVKVYAHMDDSEEMVNGSFDNLRLNSYDANNPNTVTDDMPPVIEAMYFNDEQTFSNGAFIPSSSTLYIRANDDHSFNTQSLAIGNSMSLQLDNGKTTYPYIKSQAIMSDEGKALAIEFPMNLQEGLHSLLYTVYDAAGNKATQTISFLVGNSSQMSMTVDEEPAVDAATFNITTSLPTTPQVTIKVLDNVGNLVWKTTTANFPYTWDLKDNNGTRVPAGVYKFYCTYEDSSSYGGTEIGHVIVIEPHNVSN